jgi:hypothetical protein
MGRLGWLMLMCDDSASSVCVTISARHAVTADVAMVMPTATTSRRWAARGIASAARHAATVPTKTMSTAIGTASRTHAVLCTTCSNSCTPVPDKSENDSDVGNCSVL